MPESLNSKLLLLLILLTTLIGASNLWEKYKFQKVQGSYQSEMEQLSEGAENFQKLVYRGSEFERSVGGSDSFSPGVMRNYLLYVNTYIASYKSNAKIAESILHDDKYEEYGFSNGTKEDLETVIEFENKVGRDYESKKEFLEYLIEISEIIDNEKLAGYDNSLKDGFVDYDALIGGYSEVVEELELIVPPDYMIEYHDTMIGYYLEVKRLFYNLRGITYELEAMRRDPDGYSDRVWSALMVRQEDNAEAFDRLFRENPYSADDDYLLQFVPDTFSVKRQLVIAGHEEIYLDALEGVVEGK